MWNPYRVVNNWFDTGVDGEFGRVFINVDSMEYAEEVDHSRLLDVSKVGEQKVDAEWSRISVAITNYKIHFREAA